MPEILTDDERSPQGTGLMHNNDQHRQFTQEFGDDEGFMPEYRGRYYYSGPALAIERDDLQDIHARSPMRLTSDNLGKRLIVYPR